MSGIDAGDDPARDPGRTPPSWRVSLTLEVEVDADDEDTARDIAEMEVRAAVTRRESMTMQSLDVDGVEEVTP